jgi:hypothetical protein
MAIEKEDFSGTRGWTPIEVHIKCRCVDVAKWLARRIRCSGLRESGYMVAK